MPTERAAHLVGMLTGQQVSAGFVDKANARLAAQLTGAGFEEAMKAALLAEPVLTADESPVEVVTAAKDKDTGEPVPGAPHVMVCAARLLVEIGVCAGGFWRGRDRRWDPGGEDRSYWGWWARGCCATGVLPPWRGRPQCAGGPSARRPQRRDQPARVEGLDDLGTGLDREGTDVRPPGMHVDQAYARLA